MSTKLSLQNHLNALVSKHRSLDERIEEVYKANMADDLTIVALKRDKLQLKEEIIQIEKSLVNRNQ